MESTSSFWTFIYIAIFFFVQDYFDRKIVKQQAKIKNVSYEEMEKSLISNQNNELRETLNLGVIIFLILSLCLYITASVLVGLFAKKIEHLLFLIIPLMLSMSLHKYYLLCIDILTKKINCQQLFRTIFTILIICLFYFGVSKFYKCGIKEYIYAFLPLIWYYALEKKYLIYAIFIYIGTIFRFEVVYNIPSTNSIEYNLAMSFSSSILLAGITGLLIDVSKDKKQSKKIESIRMNFLSTLLDEFEELYFLYPDLVKEIFTKKLKDKNNFQISNYFKNKDRFLTRFLETYYEFNGSITTIIELKSELIVNEIFNLYEISILETLNLRYNTFNASLNGTNKDIVRELKFMKEMFEMNFYAELLPEIKEKIIYLETQKD